MIFHLSDVAMWSARDAVKAARQGDVADLDVVPPEILDGLVEALHYAGRASGPILLVCGEGLADRIEAALCDVDVFAADTPNLNAWPQPAVRREFAEWLATRIAS